MKIEVVTVLGANGTMGRNVSAIFASFGNAKVYMVARNLSDAITAKEIAVNSVKAESISDNLIPATYDDLDRIIPISDLIFESVSENMEIKDKVLDSIENLVSNNVIIGTGSSGLSVNKIIEGYGEPFKSRFLGIQMFNPPYNLSLCELVPSETTSAEILPLLKSYFEEKLLRDVIVVNDFPAFLANRIGFKFINEAMILAESYRDLGGIDYVDFLLGNFTGRSMSPLVTADFVGLDIHKAIVDNILESSNDLEKESFVLPNFTHILFENNFIGKKQGKGLYSTRLEDNGSITKLTYDIVQGCYRPTKSYSFPVVDNVRNYLKKGQYSQAIDNLFDLKSFESKLISKMMFKYILYSLKMSLEVGNSIHAADHAMATGFNWIPPLALIDAMGGKNKFEQLAIKVLDNDYLEMMNFSKLVVYIEKSEYDYRSFLKAR